MKRHGGKRDGAGRHPVTHKKQRCNVTLAPDVLEILETLCNGNRSAAIEFVSRAWAKPNKAWSGLVEGIGILPAVVKNLESSAPA